MTMSPDPTADYFRHLYARVMAFGAGIAFAGAVVAFGYGAWLVGVVLLLAMTFLLWSALPPFPPVDPDNDTE